MRGMLLALLVGVGVTSLLSASAGGAQAGLTDPSLDAGEVAETTTSPAARTLESDPRVLAFVRAYDELIDSVSYGEDDVVFTLGAERIHFRDGRMLAEDRLDREADCDPIFYQYPLTPLAGPFAEPEEMPTYCTDLLESLWGATEHEIRRHGRSISFLDHRMFVNELLVDPLAAVEADLLRVAEADDGVSRWIDELDVTYSFSYREIAGSRTRSQHGWGLAVDFVPRSYHGRAVYWRWSRVLSGDEWYRIPVEERWSPPQRVIDTFERHGFIWGGKWPHFDGIHFEYRPEIILYSRMAEQ